MKPDRIILVRHGESEGNVDWERYGSIPDYKLRLTSRGLDQAAQAGREIRDLVGEEGTVRIYTSPFYRARETTAEISEPLAGNLAGISEDPRLREQEWGHLRTVEEGRVVEKERDAYGSFYYRIPDGESGADVYDRVTTFLDTLHRDFQKDHFARNALIVTHGLTLRLFLMRWFHWSVEQFEKLKNPENCQVVVMRKVKEERYELLTPYDDLCK